MSDKESEKSRPDKSLLTQDQLDGLIANAGEIASDQGAAKDPPPAKSALESADDGDSSELLSQDQLDALLAEAQAPEENPKSDLLSQEQLDALIASGADQEATEAEPAAESESVSQDQLDAPVDEVQAPAQKPESDVLSQDQLDAHITGGDEDKTPNTEESSEPNTLSQEQLDALIAGAENEDGAEPEAEPEKSSDSSQLTQDQLDALIADADTPEDDGNDRPPEVAENTASEGGLIDQEELDALIEQASTESDNPAASMDAPLIDQAELDTLIEDAGVADPDDAKTEPQGVDDAVAEEPVTGLEDETLVPAEAEPVTDMDAAIEPVEKEPEPPEAEEHAEELQTPEPSEESVASASESPSEETAEEVVSENLAAAAPSAEDGAAPISSDLINALVEEAGTPEAGAEDQDAADAEHDSGTEAPGVAPGVEPELQEVAAAPAAAKAGPMVSLSRNPIKAVAAVAAGVICCFTSFSVLYLNQHVEPQQVTVPQNDAVDLENAMRLAQDEMVLGNHHDAMRVLSAPIDRAEEGALKLDAQFLWTEAAYHALPRHFTPDHARSALASIHDLENRADDHPRMPEALYWKAKIHEGLDDPYAARQTYTRILSEMRRAPNIETVMLEAGQLALRLNRVEDAEDLAQRLLDQYPGSVLTGQAKLLLADAYLAQGQDELASAILNRLVATQAHTALGAHAAARLGEAALARGQYAEAIGHLENRLQSATAITEGNDRVYLLLGRSYRANGQADEAEQTLRDLIDFFPDTPSIPAAYVELSQLLNAAGRHEDALRIADQATRNYPDDAEVLRQQAGLLHDEGRLVAASNALVQAEQAIGDHPATLLEAANYSLQAGDVGPAEELYRRILTDHPGTPQAVQATIGLAQGQFDRGRVSESFETLENLLIAAKDQPHRATVLHKLGVQYETLGLKERAAHLYEDLAAETADPEYLAAASAGLLDAGEWEKGLKVAKRVDPARVPDALSYRFLQEQGKTLMRISPQIAASKLAQANSLFPEQRTPEGDSRLVEAYLASNQSPRASALIQDMAARAETDRLLAAPLQVAATKLGDYAYKRGDYRTAEDAYANASAGDDANSDDTHWAAYQHANVLAQLGRHDESLERYEQIAQSKSQWAEDAKQRARYVRVERALAGGEPLPEAME